MELLSEEKLKEFLKTIIPDQKVDYPNNISDLKKGIEYVYILTVNDEAIVVGRGKKNRAKVIFDTRDTLPTQGHIKSMLVRLYHIYGGQNLEFKRYLIPCDSVGRAEEIEKKIHKKFGGNKTSLPKSIEEKLFQGLDEDFVTKFVLNAALCSSYSGISDLRKWRNAKLLNDQTWKIICEKLCIL
ncbi:hypothetical protein [Methylophilus aquaticus]|uniref:GIY-YIG nuclease family protein n=1 Tax=Methylophilus aquaticus TaxID=1971610 RepID=A0ABT9JUB9_9PROT|nr:hypothetical protein [Methylophilus aquaticus]MDP8567731.1 hypothetical protein [Methylophilus aquaticus]